MSCGLSVSERFWSKVAKAEPDDCWLWKGHRDHGGYGRFTRDGRSATAHRTAWELANGPVPGGLMVLHHCDVRACVNPAHLYVGTASDNMRDGVSRGGVCPPHGRGERNSNARLTDAQVAAIREERANGATQAALAARYGVAPSTISRVVNGKRSVSA